MGLLSLKKLFVVSLAFLIGGYTSMVNGQKSDSSYILKTGEQASKNLDVQHEIFKTESFSQLEKAGISKDMVVWDIGCGGGAMTEYLAKTVGDKGLVYALDISEDQITMAKKKIESAGHQNVKFIVGDINNLDMSQYKKADIVYSRFLLMHVTDPKKVIKIMVSLLKSGGRISLQESSMDSVERNDANSSIKEYFDLIIAYGALKEFDYTIGRKLEKICNDLGIFSKVLSFRKNYPTSEGLKTLLSLRLDELEDRFLSANLIHKEGYEVLKREVRNFLEDKENNGIMITEQSHIVAYT